MPKKVRSMRGEVLDFDLLKIKEKMASVPAPQELKAREDFIEKRLRRRVRRAKAGVVKAEVAVEPKIVVEATPEAEKIEEQEPTTETVEKVEKAAPKKKTTKKKIKQKIKPKKTDE